ncbi:hypothetical protein C8J56DRAFT_888658 [Mycena floridula]|nr:hypothetical protein C8J56DRAFT_888658 [Mycena floridula]
MGQAKDVSQDKLGCWVNDLTRFREDLWVSRNGLCFISPLIYLSINNSIQATFSAQPPVTISVDPHAGMPSLADMSDSDAAPYDSDSNPNMPPLIDIDESDLGYGFD